MVRLMAAVGLVAAYLSLTSCVQITLAWADLEPKGMPVRPELFEPVKAQERVVTRAAWVDQHRDTLQQSFEDHVFGKQPTTSRTDIVNKREIDRAAFGGVATLSEWTISAHAEFGGVMVETKDVFGLGGFPVQVLTPATDNGSVPVIIMQTFCPAWDATPHPGVTRPDDAASMDSGMFGAAARYVFGRYICTPPFEEIIAAGYAVVILQPGLVVPDDKETGALELKRLAAGHQDAQTQWGAVGAWAWLFSRVVDALETDTRFDKDRVIVWGHSRYGKAALAAAAFDERIDGVIAHQSGTGGASLNREKVGESVTSMTERYPHWFSKQYADYGGREERMPIDQHHLISLVAPRPLLLGNARRDVWSDPNGAFRAAMAASPAWALYEKSGLNQKRLDEWRPGADIAFWIRPGTHGVVEEDWPAFLEFLNAHFKTSNDPLEDAIK